jgi:four helix bundle protein
LTFKRFEDIEAWQRARTLTKEVYLLARKEPLRKDFFFCDQLRRAAISTMANIAEGFDRGGNPEFLHFLSIAKGSSAEFRSHLYVALDASYVSEEDFASLMRMSDECSRMIQGLMQYLKTSSLKGSKFRRSGNPEP